MSNGRSRVERSITGRRVDGARPRGRDRTRIAARRQHHASIMRASVDDGPNVSRLHVASRAAPCAPATRQRERPGTERACVAPAGCVALALALAARASLTAPEITTASSTDTDGHAGSAWPRDAASSTAAAGERLDLDGHASSGALRDVHAAAREDRAAARAGRPDTLLLLGHRRRLAHAGDPRDSRIGTALVPLPTVAPSSETTKHPREQGLREGERRDLNPRPPGPQSFVDRAVAGCGRGWVRLRKGEAAGGRGSIRTMRGSVCDRCVTAGRGGWSA